MPGLARLGAQRQDIEVPRPRSRTICYSTSVSAMKLEAGWPQFGNLRSMTSVCGR